MNPDQIEDVERGQLERAIRKGLEKGWYIADVIKAAVGSFKIEWRIEPAAPKPKSPPK